MSFEIPAEWTFKNSEIARDFESHVREQLPWYELATSAVAQIARHYIGQNGYVYDVGASTGNIGRALADTLTARKATLISIEESKEMTLRFSAPGHLVNERAQEYDFKSFDFATCFLVLMFLRPEEAVELLDRLIANIALGGALVVVERTLPPDGYAGLITSRITINEKRRLGISGDEIVDKELSLAGVQRPIASDVFTSRGGVEFFRFADFAGYLFEQKS
jgi:tRNA (cmo5U34)-methyltransferase